MAYIYDLADTWNASGTTFTAIKMNVTDSASSAGSLLMDLQVGGVSRFNVTKGGTLSAQAGTAAAPGYGLGTGGVGVYSRSTARVNFATTGGFDAGVEIGNNLLVLASTSSLSWVSGTLPSSGIDLFVTRDAANTLAQRNGVNPQAKNIYNSYTDVSNYSRLVMYADGSANYYIGTQKAGTGVSASLFVGTGAGSGVTGNGALTLGGSGIQMATQAGNVFNITAGGVMSWNTDNALDIGLSTGNRPRSVYVATSVTPGRGVAVASLPTPSAGMMARVTDATTPVVGMTVAGGGAAAALCWYNGTNWTVIGV
jgi:hypothetical protein